MNAPTITPATSSGAVGMPEPFAPLGTPAASVWATAGRAAAAGAEPDAGAGVGSAEGSGGTRVPTGVMTFAAVDPPRDIFIAAFPGIGVPVHTAGDEAMSVPF